MESLKRSIVKAVSYRVLGTVTTITVSYAFSGSAKLAAAIGMTDTALKVGVYFAHERAWNKIHFGREASQDYQI
jgi:adenylylsulfate kinase